MPKKKMPIILLAEDDIFLQRMYSTKLENEGFSVMLAGDGEKACALAKKTKPDLAVLDIMMPKMDGLETLAAFKKAASLKNIPVIMLTNLGAIEDVKAAKKLGADEYVIKAHFLPSEVMAVIKKYLK